MWFVLYLDSEIETWKRVVKKDVTRFLICDEDLVREMQRLISFV